MAAAVEAGELARAVAGCRAGSEAPTGPLRVARLEKGKADRWWGTLADGGGGATMECLLATQLEPLAESGEVGPGAFVRLTKFSLTEVGGKQMLIVTGLEVEEAASAVKVEAVAAAPAVKVEAAAAAPAVPAAKAAPPSGSPPAAAKVSSQPKPGGSRRVQPIASLNPYNSNWTVLARVGAKGDLRTFSNAKNPEGKVFTCEIVDSDGTTIEVTAWHEEAAKFYPLLEVGKVYYFCKGNLRPNNQKYSSVRNDYMMTLNRGSSVEECSDAAVDTSKMQSRLEPVAFDKLATFLGRKGLVDVVGVVTSVGPLGSVKRKSDDADLQRRNLTLVDASRRSVELTVWGELATSKGSDLETLVGGGGFPVLAVKGVRVSDYNGVSLSTVGRSVADVDPAGLETAQELRTWFDGEGGGAAAAAEFKAAGEGLATERKQGAGGASSERRRLGDVSAEPMPPVGEKPSYFNAKAYVVSIKPDQTLYYMAAPDGSNKKVVEEGPNNYLCAATGKHFSSFTRRYIMRCRVTDASGEAWVNVFNDQAEAILGMKADEIAPLKEGSDPGPYTAQLRQAEFREYVLRVMTRTEEYEGEARRRLTIQSAAPVNFGSESKATLAKIQAMLGVKQEAASA